MSDRAKTMVANQLKNRGIVNKDVLCAMSLVERHLFVSGLYRSIAYTDNPLPIGHGQTISQPYVVGLMTELLQVEKTNKVLEIGTGCGYQTAILSILSKKVITLEVLSNLSKQSQKRLIKLGYNNVDFHCADGKLGWEKEAPYDRILVSAAPEIIPEILIGQLAPKGHMVIPAGSLNNQLIHIITKDKYENINIKKSIPVRFVKLV